MQKLPEIYIRCAFVWRIVCSLVIMFK